MEEIKLTGAFRDKNGNRIIVGSNTKFNNVSLILKGTNNTLIISDENKEISNIKIEFPSENGICIIGNMTHPKLHARGNIRVGYNCFISIGDEVTCTKPFFLCCAEETQILIGDDCMFATNNHIRTDDAHAIFDVVTGNRLNKSRSIIIGAHTWVSYASKIFGGTSIGEGSIVGLNSVVKGTFPNNCTIANTPAKIIRRNIAWDRPNITRRKPWIREHASQIKKIEEYWHITDDYLKSPKLGNGFNKIVDLLKKHCPKSQWIEKNRYLLKE